jgi:hypothetical protein
VNVDSDPSFQTNEDLNPVPNLKDMTIFYTYPDGGKMMKNFEILTYNIVMPYEKVKGNTGRVQDSPERDKLTKKNSLFSF